jgi:hypothetical protein
MSRERARAPARARLRESLDAAGTGPFIPRGERSSWALLRMKRSDQCLARAGELERELVELEATSALPEAPAEARIEEWVLDAYRRIWGQ